VLVLWDQALQRVSEEESLELEVDGESGNEGRVFLSRLDGGATFLLGYWA
jgi:hypothetical protein